VNDLPLLKKAVVTSDKTDSVVFTHSVFDLWCQYFPHL